MVPAAKARQASESANTLSDADQSKERGTGGTTAITFLQEVRNDTMSVSREISS